MLTHIELFAGISGFGLGFEASGIETICQVEINRQCQQVLKYHYPDIDRLDDVCKVGKHNLPYVDIISFGSPCQDLSIAGKRKGIQGERSGLFFEAIRIIRELKPAIAIWENVPGAFSSNSGRDFLAVITAFRECGARQFGWRTLDARHCGVPQRRRRIFLVADFRERRVGSILFKPESMSGNTQKGRKAGKDVAYTLNTHTGSSSCKGEGGINKTLIVPPLTCDPYGDKLSEEGKLVLDGRNLAEHKVSPTLQSKQSGGYSLNYTPMVYERGRVIPSMVSPTLKTDGSGNRLCYGVRRLTPVECERLQGFPKNWTLANGISNSARYRMLGNAVNVAVTKRLGKNIAEALK